MYTTTKAEENTAPIDTGPPARWYHWIDMRATPLRGLCGELITVVLYNSDPPTGTRLCPDCARIAEQEDR